MLTEEWEMQDKVHLFILIGPDTYISVNTHDSNRKLVLPYYYKYILTKIDKLDNPE